MIVHDIHSIAESIAAQQIALRLLHEDLKCICHELNRLADALAPKIVGIEVLPQPKENQMPNAQKMQLTKATKRAQAKKAASGTPVSTFNLVDNGNNSYTVVGVDQAGNQVDISGLATLQTTSSDQSVMTVSPSGMTFTVTAATPAPPVGSSSDITLTATWNDGSIGPFTATIKGTITGGGVVSIEVVS